MTSEGAVISGSTCPSTSSWCRDYGYHYSGNRWVASNRTMHFAVPGSGANFSQASNRLTSAFGQAVGYDNAGNMTSHPYIANVTYYADGLPNQFSSGAFSPLTPFSYTYDAEGRRVRKAVDLPGTADEVTVYVYDAFGKLAAEYSNQAMAQEVGIWFRTPDHLGSTRIVTDAGQIVRLRRDYFPFGEQIPADSSHGNRQNVKDNDVATYSENFNFTQQFTGKERDAETELDYFGARYMSAAQGRFTSPDAPFADQFPANPQSWNLYSYTRNNPLKFIDPTGRGAVAAGVRAAARSLEKRMFAAARSEAVRLAWKQERELVVRTGQGTREWTEGQMQQLISKGKVSGFEGHHINSVKGNNLSMARDPNNISFVEGRAGNLEAHGGNFQNETSGALIDRIAKLGGPGMLAFFATFDQKMNEYSSQSPIISSPNSWWSNINPVNYLVENAALLEAFAAADSADREAKKREEEERKRREGGGN